MSYFPRFLWNFWLAETERLGSPKPRIHVYDVYENILSEVTNPPVETTAVFGDFVNVNTTVEPETQRAFNSATAAFNTLECAAELILGKVSKILTKDISRKFISLSSSEIHSLRRYLSFLRFRNSPKYQDIVSALQEIDQSGRERDRSSIFSAYRPHFIEAHRQFILDGFKSFLQSGEIRHQNVTPSQDRPTITGVFQSAMDSYCWAFNESEICFGIATEQQEFILSNHCVGTLREGGEEDVACCDFFLPVLPNLTIYVIGANGEAGRNDGHRSEIRNPRSQRQVTHVEVGLESASDIHLRNALLLQNNPTQLYFSSLRAIALSIASYDEFRWSSEHYDYSRLKQRCRQKFLQETVTQTLTIKGDVIVTDLTGEIVPIQPVARGSFSEVWKATWRDPFESKSGVVALKLLHHNLSAVVREKMLKRLKLEVLAWHRLCHPNISPLFGVVQLSDSVGMVSPFCDNGTVCQYIAKHSEVDRMNLIIQIASGIAYLHSVNPVVIHGDLKGSNILVDSEGRAVITDFGLSRVLEPDRVTGQTSLFAGSTRWMAPELIFGLVADDGSPPSITTFSDVFAFGAVCLEIATGELPYGNRTNDHAVTVDILRRVKPSRGAGTHANWGLHLGDVEKGVFWQLLDRCWDQDVTQRPTMAELVLRMEGLRRGG